MLWIGVAALLVGAAVGGMAWWLLSALPEALPPAEEVHARQGAIQTALAAGAGVGAAITLMLAFRRQRHLEAAAHVTAYQAALVAENTRHDATERRVTDLYTKASEQLGHGKAAVRLAGLYALERLAQDNPNHRQTIVNVICAYLRMPYTVQVMADPEQARRDAILRARRGYQAARQHSANPTAAGPPPNAEADSEGERQVRLTAQRILTDHLRDQRSADEQQTTPPGPRFWDDIRIDLAGATLIDINFNQCHIVHADLTKAVFTGDTEFAEVTFSGDALFDGATFSGDAFFYGATFTGNAEFGRATFTGETLFNGVTFSGDAALFFGATFSRDTEFEEATFSGVALFDGATFTGDAEFYRATFTEGASFGKVSFTGKASFGETTFIEDARFDGATFTEDARFGGATFTANASFAEATFTGNALFGDVTFTKDASFGGVTFTGNAGFGGATFTANASFAEATFIGNAAFAGATFIAGASFSKVAFTKRALFGGATFTGNAGFGGATFTGVARFGRTTFTGDARFVKATFTGDARFGGARFSRYAVFDGAMVLVPDADHVWPEGWRLETPPMGACRLVREVSGKAASPPRA